MGIMREVLDGVDTMLAWMSSGLRQTTDSYCQIQTADSPTVLVAHDGSLVSIISVEGVNALVGQEEYNDIHAGLARTLSTILSRPGFSMQVHFAYNKDRVKELIRDNFRPAMHTIDEIGLQLNDLINERLNYLSKYCTEEKVHIVLWTRISSLAGDEIKRATRDKSKMIKDLKVPVFQYTQNVLAAIPELRNVHDSYVRSLLADLGGLGITAEVLEVHDAVREIRMSVDPDFTDVNWRPVLPGDRIKVKLAKKFAGNISDVLWPSLSHQLMPRDANNVDLKSARVGDKIYSCVFIDLFPKQVQSFMFLLNKTLQTLIPWRVSFMIDGGGLSSLKLKRALSGLLSFSSTQNRLITDGIRLLDYIDLNTDDSVIRLRVAASTWAPVGEEKLLRIRASQLARAIQGWGSCDVSEFCGDAFNGVTSTIMGFTSENVGTPTVASLSDTIYMLPLYRPASPWKTGALLLRTPDGKPWPYQPGSSLQTTWIDLIYARPGSGKSVLSNAINLALILSPGLKRLPRISIIDIGPSSSGLISLVKEALPHKDRHLAAYFRLQMTEDYSINPFDTPLGSRFPMPQERAFLINFITLLATPVGQRHAYDGVSDMIGMLVDEAYKSMDDSAQPNVYTPSVEDMIDAILGDIGFVADAKTSWWEVTDALFMAGFTKEALCAQRHAMPLLSDLTAICRLPAVEDLYGGITITTGETLINAFTRMISSAIREYPILSRFTKFDIGNSKIVSIDLDEVAKSGGDAADRQTAVMYMLARYVVAKDFYLNQQSIANLPDAYRHYHEKNVAELIEDPKRLVMDEFHRTSNAQSVRDQVIVDMREGRKWKVQVALLSQAIEDFDKVMIDFATSTFIMDAGPEQAIKKTTEVFGLSKTAQIALRQSVRGPREGGASFLAQFATKEKMNTQLLTLTLGPVELWAFSTTTEDYILRDKLYVAIGPKEARRVLATLFPQGTCTKFLHARLAKLTGDSGIIDEDSRQSGLEQLFADILKEYKLNPKFKSLSI